MNTKNKQETKSITCLKCGFQFGDRRNINTHEHKCIEEGKNKCLYCNKLIGDYISNYHIGCYKKLNAQDIINNVEGLDFYNEEDKKTIIDKHIKGVVNK